MEKEDVVVDMKRLQQFFFEYEFHNEHEQKVREKLLETIPVACNYEFSPYTLVAEVTSFGHTHRNLGFHLSLKFCPGCKVQLTAEFYDQLRFLGKIQGLLLGWTQARARPAGRVRKRQL